VSNQFVGEIRIFAGNFAPTGWALCNGQLLPISQNTALFSLLGTFYGGDGKSTFALPNMQGSAPMHRGQGQGLTDRFTGEQGGSEFVTLINSEMPVHTHNQMGIATNGEDPNPGPDRALGRSVGASVYQNVTNADLVPMEPNALSIAGGSLPHNNMQPYLALTFIIAMQGVFPPRS
jgi:microcystin-dependent protein